MRKMTRSAKYLVSERSRSRGLEIHSCRILKTNPRYAGDAIADGSAESGGRPVQPISGINVPLGATLHVDVYRVRAKMRGQVARLIRENPVMALRAPF